MTVLDRIKTPTALRINLADNVCVLLESALEGDRISLGDMELVAHAPVAAGHKLALRAIAAGEEVIKYGAAIGIATAGIQPGDHVHSHNLRTALEGLETYEFSGNATACPAQAHAETFMGYRRADGRAGTRNEVWIIPTVGCVAKTAERIAAHANKNLNSRADGVHAFAHPFGCSQLGDDLDDTRKILAALGGHPNAGGVLFLGLGCESNQLDRLIATAETLDLKRMRTVQSQQAPDEYEAGLEAVEELLELCSADIRVECSAADLAIGVKCGGSDGFSGLTANPIVGRVTDKVTAAGGAAILTEIPEIFGAERPLLARCASRNVFDALVAVVNDFKSYFIDHNQPIYENPSPGNIAGGITTLEEKSLGAAQKAGTQSVIADVIRYGDRAEKKGLIILEAPGNDAVSSTALTAAGATVMLFTTGRGTPLGFPAPTIKISSNSALAVQKPRWIDFDAGAILDGETHSDVAEALWRKVLDVASGAPTRNEENDERSIAIWKRGVTL
jgi:altronate hydrolase